MAGESPKEEKTNLGLRKYPYVNEDPSPNIRGAVAACRVKMSRDGDLRKSPYRPRRERGKRPGSGREKKNQP